MRSIVYSTMSRKLKTIFFMDFDKELEEYVTKRQKTKEVCKEVGQGESIPKSSRICRYGSNCKTPNCKFMHQTYTCYRCGGKDHYIHHCPQNICHLCGEKGHIAPNCTLKKSYQQQQAHTSANHQKRREEFNDYHRRYLSMSGPCYDNRQHDCRRKYRHYATVSSYELRQDDGDRRTETRSEYPRYRR